MMLFLGFVPAGIALVGQCPPRSYRRESSVDMPDQRLT